MTDTYEKIEWKLPNFREFEGNSMSGKRDGDEYFVESYDTTILRYNIPQKEVIFFNDKKLSPTTSRHQNLVREHIPGVESVEETWKNIEDGQKVNVARENYHIIRDMLDYRGFQGLAFDKDGFYQRYIMDEDERMNFLAENDGAVFPITSDYPMPTDILSADQTIKSPLAKDTYKNVVIDADR